MMRCGRCRCPHYCSKACQRADWPSHKANCDRTIHVKDTEPDAVSVNSRAMRSMALALADARTDLSMIRSFLHALARSGCQDPKQAFLTFVYRGDPGAPVGELCETMKAAAFDCAMGGPGVSGSWEVRSHRKDAQAFASQVASAGQAWAASDYAALVCAACVPGPAELTRAVSFYEDESGRSSPLLRGCGCFVLTNDDGSRSTIACSPGHRLV